MIGARTFATWTHALSSAWRSLRDNRLRTMLTAMSIMLGAATMALLVSLATSALATLLGGVDAVGGRDIVFVEPHETDKHGRRPPSPIAPGDIDSLRAEIPGVREASYLMSLRNQPVVAHGETRDVDLAIGAAYQELLVQRVATGRLLHDDEMRDVTVLTTPVAKDLFGSPEAALGKPILLFGRKLEVVGVTANDDALGFNMGGVAKERAVFLPLSFAMHREGLDPRGFGVLRFDASGDRKRALTQAAAVLRHRHGQDDVELFDLGDLIHTFDVVFVGIRAVVALLASICLLLAGAGIMNVMIATVRQRVREIGIRRAVGASARDIRRQFLTESALLGLGGGVVGSAVGTVLAALLGLAIHAGTAAWRTDLSIGAACGAALSAAVVGLVFGSRPAKLAARAPVVACLQGGVR